MRLHPLSEDLARIGGNRSGPGPVTLNRLLERTEGRGLYLLIILLCLPFVVPVSIPGASTVIGGIIALLTLRLAVGKAPRLPKFLGDHELPHGLQQRVLSGSVRFLRFIEKVARPRRTQWLGWRAARFGNSLLVAFMAVLLALPIPPIILFTNSFPCYAIILISVSMMEEDGVMIWLGYAMSLVTVVYFALWAELISRHLTKWGHGLFQLLQHTL